MALGVYDVDTEQIIFLMKLENVLKPKRILLIITDYGSFNNFLSELVMQLVRTGNEVHVICSNLKVINVDDKYAYQDYGIVFHYIEFPRSFNILKQYTTSKKIHKEVKSISPDLINIHFTTGIFTTVFSAKLPYFTVGTIHGLGYPVIKSIIKRKVFEMVEKFCFRRLDQIYLLNEVDYKLVKEIHPDKTFRYKCFGVGNDLDKFDPFKLSEQTGRALRKKLLIKQEDFVLAYCGRFTSFKGFDKVIKAFNSLTNQYKLPNVKLIIIGGEDPIHPTGLNEKDNIAYRRNGNIIKIDFTSDLNLYLAISDVFIFPSAKEGMPVCIMEALSMGIPVVTLNSRGCNDLIKHNFNGLLIEDKPGISELREAILKLYRNPNLLKSLSGNALASRNQYSRYNYVEEQMMAYNFNNMATTHY